MRYLRYSIFLSALLVATAVFLPYVQLSVGGISLGKRTTMPLFDAVTNYTFVDNAFARVNATPAERIADGVLARFGKSPTGLSQHLREVQTTLHDVQEVRDQAHLDTIGTVLRTTGVGFLLILAVVAWLILQTLSQVALNRRRAVWIAGLTSVVGLVSTALFIGVGEALVLANEEIGANLLSLGSGAYLMLVAAIVGAGSALAAIVVERKVAQDEKRSSLASE